MIYRVKGTVEGVVVGKKGHQADDEVPESKRMYRHWIEIRHIQSGTTRDLPLREVTRIHLPTKKHKEKMPDVNVLELKDESQTIEAFSLDELAALLRARYPDQSYERTLHRDRDLEAERRYQAAMASLIKLIAKAAVDDMQRKQGD